MAVRDLTDVFSTALEYPSVPFERREKPEDPSSAVVEEGVKTYVVKSPDALEGLRLTALANMGIAMAAGANLSDTDRAALRLDDDEEIHFYRRVLGATYDEMLADGVKWLVLKEVAQDALLYFGMSPEAADLTLARRSGEAKAAATRPTPTSTAPTQPRKAGSRSSKASTATRDRTRSRTSTRSSRKTPPSEPQAAAG